MQAINISSTWSLYRRFFKYIKPFWPILVLGLLATALHSMIDAGFTYMMRPFFDKGFINLDLDFIKKIPWIVLIGVTLRGIISAAGNYCMTWVARSVVNVLRQRVFAHILCLPADYYDQTTSGQFLSKMLYDVEQVAQVSADALSDMAQNIFLIIGLIVVMMVISWPLSLMFLATVPLIGVVVNFTNKRIRRISHKVQQSMAKVTEIASEVIEGYRVVRVFGGEQYEKSKFNMATNASRINDMKVAVSKALNVSLVQAIIACGISAIIFATIKLSTLIVVSAGSFLAVIAAMLQLIKPIKSLTSLHASVQRGLAGAESIFCLLDQPLESEDMPVSVNDSKITHGGIEFNNVSFAYRNGPNVLHNLDFQISPGETVALVGHSGSGKSTIASLLPRFYNVTSGCIMIDGVLVNDMSLTNLRKKMAFVSQHVTLFNDSIANNIAYGDWDIPMEQIVAAAKLAYADEFIQGLPQGYATQVGENGLLLSGGQRQRLAIARAILKNAPILILDEATSALDNTSERYIQDSLEHVVKNRTTLIIAHRLSTIQRANKIIVLQHGRVVEIGRHQDLIQLNGHYAQLHNVRQAVPECV